MAHFRTWREDPPPGFTLLELLVVTVIIGTLSTMVAPSLQRAREMAEVAAASSEIRIIEAELTIYWQDNFVFPASLAAINRAGLLDPWGYTYIYNPLTGPSSGEARKDKFMVPLNTDYDLYSVGPDGLSKGPLNAKDSKDDVIRANDGGFVGLASKY